MANGYSAGDLNLNIRTSAEDTLKYLDAVVERLNFIQRGLGGIKNNAHISKSYSQTPKSNGGSMFGYAKLGVNIYMLRRMGKAVANLVQAGSDYTETLNLWQVAMRDNLDVADQFITKMNKAYGISTKTLMNAQAIFKNMIGSLGQISDETAYKLSEALVQMSADFSSLYNVQLESAFSKMQSMLAGQVRPIRSAGLDMTETTLFMFYQQLGGTKTMRQLNRTEKQLLSILAVYKQMGSAGALGDMSKTLNQFANQSRMMTEYWQELKTWSGLLLKDLIDESGMLVYINALLITTTEIIKSIAKSRCLGEENFIDGLFETTEATNDAVDELQGKLLDFDKFRSLQGAETNVLGIDEKLLEAISGYSSKIDQATNAAQQLADTWLEFWLNDDGTLTTQAGMFLDTLELIAVVLGVIVGYKMFTGLSNIALGLSKINASTVLLVAGFSALIYGLMKFNELADQMTVWEKITGIILAITAAIVGFYVATTALKASLPVAIAAGAALSGSMLAIAASIKQSSIPNYENGASDIDSGTIFRAGEFGKTEAVYTGSNGKTNVANIQQMEAAELQALNKWWAKAKHDIPAFQGVSDSGIYTIVDGEAKRRGKKFANV